MFIVCCGLSTWRKEFILLILCKIFNWSFCINWEQSLNWILLCEISSAWKVFPTEWTIPFLNSFIYYVVHRIYIFSPFSNIKITFPIDRHQKLAQDSFSKAIHYSYNSTDPKWENQEQWMCNLCIHGTYKYTALQWLWKIKGRKCSWFVVWCMQNWWNELLVQKAIHLYERFILLGDFCSVDPILRKFIHWCTATAFILPMPFSQEL